MGFFIIIIFFNLIISNLFGVQVFIFYYIPSIVLN